MTRQQGFLAEIRTFVAHFLAEARRDPLLATRVSRDEDVFLALGDYAQGAALRLLNLSDAAEAIVASDDDGRNVLTALLLKQLAPGLRVVVAVLREELRETLHAAGVTYVISPSDLGGRMVAAAAIEPEIAQTFDDLTTSSYHYGMEEYPLRPPNPLVGLDFDTASRRLRESTGAILVGVAQPDPNRTGDDPGFRAILAPPPATVLTPGGYALLLAAEIDRPRRDRWLGVPPGRPVKPTSGRSGAPEPVSTGPDSASSP
jgi:voltage-gated potassium channel Kch